MAQMVDIQDSQSLKLIGITWTWFGLAVTFVTIRFYTRIVLVKSLSWDDLMILISLMADLVMSIFRQLYASHNFARHIQLLSKDEQVFATKLAWISLAVAIAAHSTGRASVALMINRIQGPCKWRSRFLTFILISIVATAGPGFLLSFFQCHPPRALWDTSLVDEGRGSCLDDRKVTIAFQGLAGYWCSLDFILAATPVTILWDLQMPRRKKILIGCLLGLGVFAGICAAIKVWTLSTLSVDKDTTWIEVTLFIWDTNEISVIIIAACIATSRPFFRALKTGNFGSKDVLALERRAADEVTMRVLGEGRYSTSTNNTVEVEDLRGTWTRAGTANRQATTQLGHGDGIMRQVKMSVSFEDIDNSTEAIPDDRVIYARNIV